MLPIVRPNMTKSNHWAALYRPFMSEPIVPATTTKSTSARSAHSTTSTAFSRFNACDHVCPADAMVEELTLTPASPSWRRHGQRGSTSTLVLRPDLLRVRAHGE